MFAPTVSLLSTHVAVLSIPENALFEENSENIQVVAHESETPAQSEVLHMEQCSAQTVESVPTHLQLDADQEQIAGSMEQEGDTLNTDTIPESKVYNREQQHPPLAFLWHSVNKKKGTEKFIMIF